MSAQKTRFVWKVLKNMERIGEIVRETRDQVDVYIDRGYAPAGANPITDADLNVTLPGEGIDLQGLTVAEFGEAATVLLALLAFADGQAVQAANYEAIINKYRRDV